MVPVQIWQNGSLDFPRLRKSFLECHGIKTHEIDQEAQQKNVAVECVACLFAGTDVTSLEKAEKLKT